MILQIRSGGSAIYLFPDSPVFSARALMVACVARTRSAHFRSEHVVEPYGSLCLLPTGEELAQGLTVKMLILTRFSNAF